MKFSYNWIKTIINYKQDINQLVESLTMSGLEVESVNPVAPEFNKIVVAKVLEVTKHENSDKLHLTKVDIGDKDYLQIVCGAPNVKAGIKVPCAIIGAVLPNKMEIKPVKLRGEDSFGMLCSKNELGIGHSDGLFILDDDAKVGSDIRDYLDLNDYIIDLSITPNRADCLSIKGIVREITAIFDIKSPSFHLDAIPNDTQNIIKTTIEDKENCGKFISRVINNIDITKKTPLWMRNRLERSGINPINIIVDIGNYVMLEIGQPMHMFDLHNIDEEIFIRKAKKEEKLQCLNGKIVELDTDTLVIADKNKALSIAGIIGGEYSSIKDNTKNILLEAAFFNPDIIIGKSRKYGFTSDSAYRFERGVDYKIQIDAIHLASKLILEHCGGNLGPINEVIGNCLPKNKTINLRADRVNKILGIKIDNNKIKKILTSLNFNPIDNKGVFIVEVPSYRFDINIEIDLIEEIARIYGYDNINNTKTINSISILPFDATKKPLSKIYDILISKGYHEVINYAFIDEKLELDFNGNNNPIRLKNPIASNLNIMQSNLIVNLINTLINNINRKQERIKIFEIANIFKKIDNEYLQEKHLGGLAYGNRFPLQWDINPQKIDFYDIKNDIELLLFKQKITFTKLNHPAFHPGKAVNILLDNENIGFLGELHPKWCQKYDIPLPPIIFELKLQDVLKTNRITYKEISKFQPVKRDLSLLVPKHISAQVIIDTINSINDETIKKLTIFDLYQGENIEKSMISIAISLIFQHNNSTLTLNEIENKISNILNELKKLNILLRN